MTRKYKLLNGWVLPHLLETERQVCSSGLKEAYNFLFWSIAFGMVFISKYSSFVIELVPANCVTSWVGTLPIELQQNHMTSKPVTCNSVP